MQKNALFVAIACALIGVSALAVPVAARADDSASANGGSAQTTMSSSAQTSTASGVDTKKAAKGNESADAMELAPITVLATRRAEAIDTVPLAVTAIGGEALRMGNVPDTQSLSMLSPSLVVSTSTSEEQGGSLRLRGVGTTGQNAGLEGAVGVFVDGVYQANAGLALQDLFDIKQIEVVRGPQSTLYGKNTSAGVINVRTNEPTFDTEGLADVTFGNYDSRTVTGVLSGALSKTLAVRVAARYNERDGYIDDIVNGDTYNDRNRWSVRAQALWQPSDGFSLRVIADSVRKRESCCAAPFTLYGPKAATLTALGAHLVPALSYDQVALSDPTQANLTMSGISAELKWNRDWGTTKLLVSNYHGQTLQAADGDRTDLSILHNPGQTTGTASRTVDFSMQGNAGRLDWLAGLYYANQDVSFYNVQLFGPDSNAFLTNTLPPKVPLPRYPNNTGSFAYSQQSGHSESIYTHDIVHFDHGIDLTFGVRYLQEAKNGYGYATSNVPSCTDPKVPGNAQLLCAIPRYDVVYDDKRTLGTVSLSKTLGGDGVLYATFSNGFKAGGINLNPSKGIGTSPEFGPETVKNYEVGVKLPGIVRNLDLRATAFVENFNNLQLNTFNGLYLVISNAASATTKGVELEGTWYIAPGYSFTGGYTYDKATYGQNAVDATLRGQPLTNAPRNAASLGFNVRQPFGSRVLVASINARYQSQVNTGSAINPNFLQGGRTLLNARLGLRWQNGFTASLWARNLTDKHYYNVIIATTAQAGNYSGFPGEPRMFGIELRKEF
ncbi:MAG: TonB-dependent receptor [Proteobacteria bacterium]|nr:TonB-dependent receptor [Pseudomonadota bacterium]